MNRSSTIRAAAGLVAALALAGCAGAAPPPAAGAAAGQGAAAAPTPARRGYTEADVRFMQHMIAHHAQALVMTALVPERSRRDDVKLLAERIDVSQQDEIAMMQGWLRSRGEAVPDPEAHHAHGAAPMPGMLTAEEMQRLTRASGAEFDRLFLESMIRHHEGALAMVAELLATPGAGEEPEVFRFASDVDADQRMEIERMRRLLGAASTGGTHR